LWANLDLNDTLNAVIKRSIELAITNYKGLFIT
jgi:hypothetical protein